MEGRCGRKEGMEGRKVWQKVRYRRRYGRKEGMGRKDGRTEGRNGRKVWKEVPT
jgi:hypothetical protein